MINPANEWIDLDPMWSKFQPVQWDMFGSHQMLTHCGPRDLPEIVEEEGATSSQIEKAAFMGWIYEGQGLFSRGEDIGWFTESGFVRE